MVETVQKSEQGYVRLKKFNAFQRINRLNKIDELIFTNPQNFLNLLNLLNFSPYFTLQTFLCASLMTSVGIS
jgi:hypothetical protein